jgi:hypothetical protein
MPFFYFVQTRFSAGTLGSWKRVVAGVVATLVAVSAIRAANLPLKIGPTQRSLACQGNEPFLVHADAPWSLIVGLTKEEAEVYLEDRRAKGFNVLIVELIEHKYGGVDNTYGAPTNRYGNAPFLTSDDLSTPNEAYFLHADWVIDRAGAKGIVLFLTPAYLGYNRNQNDDGWYDVLRANGDAKCRGYGNWLGERYRNKPNLVWMMGGDSNPDQARTMVDAMAAGIKERDTNHLFTAHTIRGTTARAQYGSSPWLDVDTVYPVVQPANLIIDACVAAYGASPPMPVIMIEAWYENEHDMTPLGLRRQAYWSNLSGCAGQSFGNYPVWGFYSGWTDALNSDGARDMVQVRSLFESRPWWLLEADTAHLTVTAGYGSGTSTVTTARASNGATVIAYLPAGGTLTVDLSRISGSEARGWWFNPRDGNATATTPRNFPTTGSQAFSAPSPEDWVLVLDDTAMGYPAPGTSGPSSLAVTTASVPGGQVGVAYNTALSATGGTAPYAWSLAPGSGPLPGGVTLSGGGVLSGTPTASGSFGFTVRVTDNVGATADQALTLVVAAALQLTTASVPGGQVGVAYNTALSATGGTAPYAWSLALGSGPLPGGVTLSGAGVLSGTPTTSGSFGFTVRVTDNVGATADQALTLVVAAALQLTTASVPGGQVGVAYNTALSATGGTAPYAWSLAPGSGPLPGGVTLSGAGVLSGTPTTAGTFNFTVRVTDAASATADRALTLVVAPAPLGVTTGSLGGGQVGSAYSATLEASGGVTPYSWALAPGSGPVPGGLNLSGAGVLSGTPTTAGTFNFTVRVTDAASATADRALTLVVAPAPLVIMTTGLTNAYVGIDYSATLSASGGVPPYAWALEINSAALPKGLTLSTDGVLMGVPETAGDYPFSVVVTDAGSMTSARELALAVSLANARLAVAPQMAEQIATNGFGMDFRVDAPGRYALEFSEGFSSWSNLFSFEMGEQPQATNLLDKVAGSSERRFYRVKRE